MRSKRSGFTLIELLVVVAIIAILVAILIPNLSKAKQQAVAASCGMNMNGVGKGIIMYTTNYDGKFPLSYMYDGSTWGGSTVYPGPGSPPTTGAQQLPTGSANGYLHWSYFLFNTSSTVPDGAWTCAAANIGPATGNNSNNSSYIGPADSTIPGQPYAGSNPKAFTCGAFPDGGGLPATDPFSDQFAAGQAPNNKTCVDYQAPRMAFTLNEAICPRGKLVYGYDNGGDGVFSSPSRFVKDTEISRTSSVILGTEFPTNFSIVTGFDATTGVAGTSKSHRPVNAFIVAANTTSNYVEMNDFKASGATTWAVASQAQVWDSPNTVVAANTGGAGTGGKSYNALNDASINGSNFAPIKAVLGGETSGAKNCTRVDWVGRNHPNLTTNFLYCDGHVERKTKEQTLPTTVTPMSGGGGEWGEHPYSLVGY